MVVTVEVIGGGDSLEKIYWLFYLYIWVVVPKSCLLKWEG